MLNPVAVTSTAATLPEVSSSPVLRTATATADAQPSSTTTLNTANPSYVLDLGLGLVVLQYHDHSGDVTSSIPSERQLQAYRDGGSHIGESPVETSATL